MKMLFGLCRTNVKLWKEFPEGQHNDTVVSPGYFDNIKEFINDQVIMRH